MMQVTVIAEMKPSRERGRGGLDTDSNQWSESSQGLHGVADSGHSWDGCRRATGSNSRLQPAHTATWTQR